jgi:hypothetical protein
MTSGYTPESMPEKGKPDFDQILGALREELKENLRLKPVMHLCDGATPTTTALSPHSLQRLGERLAAQALRFLRKLANGKVCFLLAGARFTESYTPDLHDC